MSILFAIWVGNSERILVGSTCLGRCLCSSRPDQAGRPHKGPSYNCLPRGVGERQKIVYTNEKGKSFYAS
jgi:hypothetical protein